MIAPLIAYTWLLCTAACFVAAVWTQDLRWLGTGIILVMMFLLPSIVAKSGKERDE